MEQESCGLCGLSVLLSGVAWLQVASYDFYCFGILSLSVLPEYLKAVSMTDPGVEGSQIENA